MRTSVIIRQQRGFTLIELLMVLGMLSLAMMALYSLYRTHQRSAYVQDEVVELQQNLRIGMDTMTKDIRMAGLLIPTNTNAFLNTTTTGTNLYPVSTAGTASFTLMTASPVNVISTITATRAGLGLFTLENAQAVDPFSNNDLVTIVRAQNRTLPAGVTAGTPCYFKVTGLDRNGPSLTLSDVNCATSGSLEFKPLDVIVKLDSGGTYPSVITYEVKAGGTCPANQTCLMRTVNGTANVVAQNISGLQLGYVQDNGSLPLVPDGTLNGTIRSIAVTLTGQTVATKALSDDLAKQRQLSSVISIRNRYGVTPLVF